MSVQILRFASLKPSPWANGGGVTRQLAAGTAASFESGAESGSAPIAEKGAGKGAGNGDTPWDWRISIAEVASAGPFSALPGVDRILTIIDGELIALTVDGVEHALEKFRPFRFSGDSATSATLPTGPLRDLNLMTRRGVVSGHAVIVELSAKRPHPVFAGQFAVLLRGSATVSPHDGGTTDTLGPLDAVVGAADAPLVHGRGFLAVLSVDPVAAG